MKQIITICLSIFAVICMAGEPKRIVAIDGSLTEIVYALGAEDALIAIDDTSVYPQAAQSLPSVGYMRALSTEGILSVKPDLVLMTDSAGPDNVITALISSGVDIQVINNTATVNGVREKIEQVALALQQPDQAATVLTAFNEDISRLETSMGDQENPLSGKKALIFMGMQSNQFMAAGQSTKAQAIMDILSLKNAVNHRGYKPLSKESILMLQPDIVIIATHGQADTAGFIQALGMTPAAKNQRIMTIDSNKLLSFGPRLPEALNDIVSTMNHSMATR